MESVMMPEEETTVMVRTKNLPQPITVIGKDNRITEYLLVPTRNNNGAQLCLKETYEAK